MYIRVLPRLRFNSKIILKLNIQPVQTSNRPSIKTFVHNMQFAASLTLVAAFMAPALAMPADSYSPAVKLEVCYTPSVKKSIAI